MEHERAGDRTGPRNLGDADSQAADRPVAGVLWQDKDTDFAVVIVVTACRAGGRDPAPAVAPHVDTMDPAGNPERSRPDIACRAAERHRLPIGEVAAHFDRGAPRGVRRDTPVSLAVV